MPHTCTHAHTRQDNNVKGEIKITVDHNPFTVIIMQIDWINYCSNVHLAYIDACTHALHT